MGWFIKDPCGIICAGFTWFLIFYAVYVGFVCVITPTPSPLFQWFNGIVFGVLSIFAFIAHFRAMLSDPGAIPKQTDTPDVLKRLGYKPGDVVVRCPKCSCIKPERTHHCSICRRCIAKMDHHCPWVNNCVGERNQKFFVLFTLYISTASFYLIYIVVHHFIICATSNWDKCKYYHSPPATTILIVFAVIEALLFGLFTAFMCCDQVCNIWRDETGIESLKKERHHRDRYPYPRQPGYSRVPTSDSHAVNMPNSTSESRPNHKSAATLHTVNVEGELTDADVEDGSSAGDTSNTSSELWQRGRGGRWLSMRTVFGGVKPSLLWLSPLHEPRLATAVTTRLAHTLVAAQQEADMTGVGEGGGEMVNPPGTGAGTDGDNALGSPDTRGSLINV